MERPRLLENKQLSWYPCQRCCSQESYTLLRGGIGARRLFFILASRSLSFPRTHHGFYLQTPAKSRDDIGEQGADKKDTGAMSPESESGPDDRGDSKTVEEVARVEANSSSVEQGPAVAQEQRLEDPPFIQVGEKVCFSTVVKAVLIPSIEDMPQGEKNHIW